MKEEMQELLEKVKQDDVKLIHLMFTDVLGNIKASTIPVERLPEALEKGIWFDGSSIEGFKRIYESDMFLKPDTSTYAILPWGPKEGADARFICDVYTPDGKPFEGDPRCILKKTMKEAEDMGFIYNVGPELEFFLFKKNNGEKITTDAHDAAGYFDFAPRDLAWDVRRDIVFSLQSLGIEVEMSHHEVAIGQHEIDFKYNNALRTADNAITLKLAVKSIAHKYGLHASFMPKPIFGENGSGMHTHQSLFDIKANQNAFFDAKDKYKLSKIAKSFIAGQLEHVKAMCPIMAPTVNSYKRLVPGYEAPVYICWAQINRSALIRIPRYSEGREQSTRAELRCPDPSCNPYLAFAVMLKTGLDGIKKKKEPPMPVEENVYHFDDDHLKKLNISTLPYSLWDALKELEKDDIVKEALGKMFYERYIQIKKAEWDSYRIQVTDWELKRYLEVT